MLKCIVINRDSIQVVVSVIFCQLFVFQPINRSFITKPDSVVQLNGHSVIGNDRWAKIIDRPAKCFGFRIYPVGPYCPARFLP